jgi:hypothetical protein
MKRNNPYIQQKADDLMKAMRKKSVKTSTLRTLSMVTTASASTTPSLLCDGNYATTGVNRPMILLLESLKKKGVVHTNAPVLLLDTLEAPHYNYTHYLALTSIQKLWFSQRLAVEFIQQREADVVGLRCRGGLLCDEMGSGKSKVVLSTVLEDNQALCKTTRRRFNGTTLIICPPMLVDGWLDEIDQFPPTTFVSMVVRCAKDLEKMDSFYVECCCDIVITTYPMIASLLSGAEEKEDILFSIRWRRVVADEGQTFVNESTDIAKGMMALDARSKWVITGTPIQNRSSDMTTLLRYVGLTIPPTMNIEDIGELVNKVMLMRSRADIERYQQIHQPEYCMPELKSVTRKVQLVQFRTTSEKVLYYSCANFALLRRISPLYARYKKVGPTPTIIQLMRQLCTSPFIVKGLVVPDGLILLDSDSIEEGESRLFDAPSNKGHVVPNSLAQFIDQQPTAFHLSHECGDSYNKNDPIYGGDGKAITEGGVSTEGGEEAFTWDPYGKNEKEFDLTKEGDREDYLFLYRELCKSLVDEVEWQITEEMNTIPTKKAKAMLTHLFDRVLRKDRPSSKEQAIVDYVVDTPPDDKIIIYSFYTGILTGIERALTLSGFRSVLITGKTKHGNDQLRKFKEDGTIKVLLITLKLGNYGLNIPMANHVLVADPWWNPHVMEQAEARVKRPGQLKDIFVVYFIMDNTLELCIMNLTIKKKGILKSFLEPSSTCPSTITDEEATLLFNYNISMVPI